VLQTLGLVSEVDSVLAPRLLLRHQLELSAEQWVEWVCHPNARTLSLRIGCS